MTEYTKLGSESNNDFEKRREAWGLQVVRDSELGAIDLRLITVSACRGA